jgi:hypothetical protein
MKRPARARRVRSGAPLVISLLALVVAISGVQVVSAATGIVKVALFAKNAGTVNGIKASRVPRPGQLVALNVAAKLPHSVIPTVAVTSVSGIRASTRATAGALFPLGFNAAFPESVIPLDSTTKAPNVAARIYSDVDQAIPNSAGGPTTPETFLHFSRAEFDTAGLFRSAAPDRLTVPVAGVYLISATVSWDPKTSGAGERVVRLAAKGIVVAAQQAVTPGDPFQSVTGIDRLSPGDIVQVVVGSTNDTKVVTADGNSSSLSVVWLAPG